MLLEPAGELESQIDEYEVYRNQNKFAGGQGKIGRVGRVMCSLTYSESLFGPLLQVIWWI